MKIEHLGAKNCVTGSCVYRVQKTEGRRQRTEGRRQRTEGSSQEGRI
jgi:hypothetical protein